MTSRRDFILQSSVLTAGLFVDKNSFFKGKEIGLQLYTVRSEVNKEKLASTIKTIAEAGYKNVELFGYNNRQYFGHSIKEMADMLKQNGLKSYSGHYGLADMMHAPDYNWESWKYLLDDAKTLGHKYVIIPYLDDKHRTADDYKRLAERLNKGGEMARKMGMCAGYHNHNFEFEDLNGTNGWEILLNNTDPKHVVFEMDIYWVVYAGQDPIAWFRKHPGRFKLWHIKDLATQPEKTSTIVGTGTIDFKKLYAERKLAGLEFPIVEQEAYTKPVFECIRESYTYVKNNIVI